jgi:carbon-monoxide dehydrogenase large subunit
MIKFGIGQSARRKEDERLLTGKGRYVDDFTLPGQAYAAFLRSPHAHAAIRRVDTTAAKRAPGVLAVYTGADFEASGLKRIKCFAPLKSRDGSALRDPSRPLLAVGRVMHVGDPVAIVVAETLAQAKDALEQIEVDYDALAALVDPERALEKDAPRIWDEIPDNTALDYELGDAKAVDAAFASAARVVRVRLPISRVAIASIEPRGVLAQYDAASERYTVYIGSQGVMGMRDQLAYTLGTKKEQVRVITADVGGSFGMKGFPFPENGMVPWAAKQLGRPVKWISERQEAFTSDTQGREQIARVEIALDKEHRFLAIRGDIVANMGAYLSGFSVFIPTLAGTRIFTGAYRIPAAHVRIRSVFTNTVWVDAYRGAGRPETAFTIESAVDAVAREVGIAPDELRRRNFVPPEAMPYTVPTAPGVVYDSGEFAAAFALALERAAWSSFEARRAEAKARGRLRGIGLAYYLEVTAPGPRERTDVAFTADGRVRITVGTGASGQGHETSFAQVVADRLGVPFELIDCVSGDSDLLKQGGGTGGAKSMMLAGTSLLDASEKIVARGRNAAGHFLEAAATEIEFRDGRFTIVGTDRSIEILELAHRLGLAKQLPADVPATLDDFGMSTTDKSTYPNGCHVCELEVDPETGAVSIERYSLIDDFGALVNPLLLQGQIHGGIVQGAGQILLEQAAYDRDSGQLIAGSFMDYAMPRAADMPSFEIDFRNVPCRTNTLGLKGAGEAGTVGSLGAVANALSDALAQVGAGPVAMPATPYRVWQAIQTARG